MEDVFYMCNREVKISDIKHIFEKNQVTNIGYADENRMQLLFGKETSINVSNNSMIGENCTDISIDHFIEFYIFDDDTILEAEEMKSLQNKEIKTVVGILHHTRHINEVLYFTKLLMKEWGGYLGTDNDCFEPCYVLEDLDEFEYGYYTN